MEVLSHILSLILQPCYNLTQNWWISILLFTVIVKIILFPMSLWCQKNSIVMVQLMPALFRIKIKYFGDRETISEKQNALYKENHYHALLSLVPLAVQIVILFGLVDVIHSITDYGAPGTEFLGLIPFEDGGLSWIMPLLAGLSAIVMGFAQNRINPLQKEQSKAEKNMTNGLSIALSFVLGVFVAAGMAFYWICSNLTSIAIQALCNIVIKPRKYIDYDELNESRDEFESLNNLSKRDKKWWQNDPLVKREKADYKRFFSITGKHVVFVSEKSGFYRYYQGAIEWLLAHSSVCIHYVTQDANDQVFALAEQNPRILPYYIEEKKLITLMMKMDADVVVTTQEDLDTFYIKRSYVRKDTEYIFMPHHMTSVHLVSSKTAYLNYDAFLCVGSHQMEELRAMEKLYGTRKKELVACGYDLLDRQIESYKCLEGHKNEKPTILIAPSWQEDCILDLCIDDLIRPLLGKGYYIIVRPHPEYTKRRAPHWEQLQQRFVDVSADELYFEHDFSSSESIFMSDVLVTDWSSIFCEFAFSTLKPCAFIDTPMKEGNPQWRDVDITPTDITLRNRVGISFDPNDLKDFGPKIDTLIANQAQWRQRIADIRAGYIYNHGKGAEVAGEYILGRILAKQVEVPEQTKQVEDSGVSEAFEQTEQSEQGKGASHEE